MSAAVASSSTLWATASKEWVIQPKPKPGRKPKKDIAALAVNDDTEVDSKGRRVQNRAAQRAFRERKQSQLAELQARVQSYEQGEIERNVALQNIAKRLKEENDMLLQQNSTLKEQLARVEAERDALLSSSKKRSRDASPAATSTSNRKKAKMTVVSDPPTLPVSRHSLTYDTYSPSPASSPESHDTPGTPFSAADSDHESAHSYPQFPAVVDYDNVSKSSFDSGFPSYGCGFCSEDTSCVCREIAMQSLDPSGQSQYKLERFDDTSPVIHLPSQPNPSILDNLPKYQPAVPLRRKPTGASQTRTIFAVSPAKEKTASCSGDPQNCQACANDTFGKAFCEAIGQSSSSHTQCDDCPGSSDDILMPAEQPARFREDEDETISTDNAWRQLKSHPNVSFSDLTLLADVVARRSKCTGPRVVISPAPGTVTPERSTTPSHSSSTSGIKQEHRASPPRLVPEEVLLRCGQRRLREVQSAGVRDALRLLDAKFS